MVWGKSLRWGRQSGHEREEKSLPLSEKISVTRVLDIPYFDGGAEEALALALARVKSRTPSRPCRGGMKRYNQIRLTG